MTLLARERMFAINLREAYLLSKPVSALLSSRVVLFLSAPEEALDEKNLHRIFGANARRSWPVTKLAKLESLVENRNDKAMDLELAEVHLSKEANKTWLHDRKRSSA